MQTHPLTDGQRASPGVDAQPLATLGRRHKDRYVHYSHAVTDATADACTRILVRVVPLAYGVVFGALIDSLALGVALGLVLGSLSDLGMGAHSMLLPALHWMRGAARPVAGSVLRGTVRGLQALGGVVRHANWRHSA